MADVKWSAKAAVTATASTDEILIIDATDASSKRQTKANFLQDYASLTGSQTLTNKTITTPVISAISNTGTVTLPTATTTLVGTGTTDTLTNKTMTAGGNTFSGFTHGAEVDEPSSGVHGVTGTIVGTSDAQTLTNKTLTAPIISSISNTGTLTLPTSTDTLVGRATTDTFTNKTFDANGTGNSLSNVDLADLSIGAKTESIIIACSDEATTDLTTGTAVVTFRMPYAFTLTDVRSSVSTAPVGSTLVVDINEGGTTVLSTKLSIDASEKTSTTAATPPVISDSALADDAEITIDIDQIGSSTAGRGLKVYLIGYQS